jgi:hypothetical protein
MQFDRRQLVRWPENLDQLVYFQIRSVDGRNPRTCRRWECRQVISLSPHAMSSVSTSRDGLRRCYGESIRGRRRRLDNMCVLIRKRWEDRVLIIKGDRKSPITGESFSRAWRRWIRNYWTTMITWLDNRMDKNFSSLGLTWRLLRCLQLVNIR